MRSNIINSNETINYLSLKAGSTDVDSSLDRHDADVKKEYNSLQQENSKLHAIIQDVTSVNKRWQLYNNDRQVYVQKLLQTIQDLQEQINTSSERKALQNNTNTPHWSAQEEVDKLRSQVEQSEKKLRDVTDGLKREHREHVAVLELQIKSHKDDWEAECREKKKIQEEKENLERLVNEMTLEISRLKERKDGDVTSGCSQCLGMAQANPVRVSKTISPKTYRTSVHFPYSSSQLFSKASSLFFDEELVKDGGDATEGTETNGKHIGQPVYDVVKESQLKSILKKEENKKKMLEKKNVEDGGASSDYCYNERNSHLSLGFYKNGLANVRAFEHGESENNEVIGLWESDVETDTRNDIICPSCDSVFPTSTHLQFLDHFEYCQKKSNELISHHHS